VTNPQCLRETQGARLESQKKVASWGIREGQETGGGQRRKGRRSVGRRREEGGGSRTPQKMLPCKINSAKNVTI
jgi:hypothetical protein